MVFYWSGLGLLFLYFDITQPHFYRLPLHVATNHLNLFQKRFLGCLETFFSGRGARGEKSAAAGFEDVKAKLGLAQNKSLDLEREAASLKKKVRSRIFGARLAFNQRSRLAPAVPLLRHAAQLK